MILPSGCIDMVDGVVVGVVNDWGGGGRGIIDNTPPSLESRSLIKPTSTSRVSVLESQCGNNVGHFA